MSDYQSPAAIIEAERARAKRIPVKEWGGHVYIRPLPTAVMIEFDDLADEGGAVPLTRIVSEYGNRVLRFGMCDPDGEHVFEDEDAVAVFLAEVSLVPVSSVIGAIMDYTADVAGLSNEAEPEQAVAALVKN